MIIGKGSFGTVKLHTSAAMKQIPLENSCISRDAWREWYVYRILSSHPHIVEIFETKIQNNQACFVMQLAKRNIENLSFENDQYKKECMFAIVNALAFLHSAELVYLDVKTSNILDFGNGVYKLCDFGSTTFTGQQSQMIVVTRWWRPPELLRSKTFVIEPSIDCWGVGVIMHDIWCEDYTFDCDNEYELERKIKKFVNTVEDEELREMIDSLIQIDPMKRNTMRNIAQNKWWGKETIQYKNKGDVDNNYFHSKMCSNIYSLIKNEEASLIIEKKISYDDCDDNDVSINKYF